MYGNVCTSTRIGEMSAAHAREALVEWVPRAVAGEREARERVVAVVYPLVRRYCFARLGRGALRAVAEDVAHETCVALMTALPRYSDQGSSFLTYVYAIAGHKVIDARRAAGRTCAPLEDAGDVACPNAGPEERLIEVESGEQARELVESLPPRYREIVVMRLVWGMSAAETADALGTTPGAVRVAQHRALGRLRTRLRQASDVAA
ncbi:sigma-70 family RNA polymerase sigma factor [Prescottella agglutinans]|uniref:Sigma-70 family RNA polymerase sigma factor n=1 Tax=Prescottella agglutinans TaxID=1644129 RepID=A0A438BF20_9NOCA|nr:sigma-70 family RNA polymerase sigma factor [Prescottella agglutinans]